jgi:signal transduction histidine kinase
MPPADALESPRSAGKHRAARLIQSMPPRSLLPYSGPRWRGGTILRWLLVLAAPLSAWPLLAWLHATTAPEPSLRSSGWQLRSAGDAAPISLPDDWRRRGYEAREAVYEHRFVATAPPAEPWAVYVESLGMNAEVLLNGRPVGDAGRMEDPVRRNWARPLLFDLVPSSVRAGENVLRVRVASDEPHFGFLGNVYVGPIDRLMPAYDARYALKVTAVWIITACQVLVALFTAALWLRWRDEESYGWFAVATIAWAATHLSLLVTDPPLRSAAWTATFVLSLGVWASLETCFVVAFLGYRRSWLARLSLWTGVAGAVTVAALAATRSPLVLDAGLAWLTVLLALGPATVAMTIRALGERGSGAAAALPNLLGLTVVPCALHDWMVLVGLIGGGIDFFLPYVALPAVVGMSWALLRRFVVALRDSEAAVAELGRRVREKHDQLEGAYRRLREVERTRVLADERERIMREMHDGLGSHLVSSLALIEAEAPRAQVSEALRGALEDLRVMVDALVPIEGDLVTALAMLRSRLAPRLEAGGVHVQWSVDNLPPVSPLGPHAVLQVLRIVQEAITNVLKHAGARSLVIRCGAGTSSAGAGGVVVEVTDDGRGLGQAPRAGRGLASMRRRAQTLGGEVVVSSSAGTTVRLWMPRGEVAP